MPSFSSGPGVYVNESLTSSFTLPTPSGPISVFFGEAARGPSTATLVSDWPSYKRIFGDLEDQYDLGFSVYHFFANGGRNAYVVRTYSSTADPADVDVSYRPGTGAAASVSASFFTATAISPGTWGNSLSIKVEQGLTDSTFSVTLYHPTATAEVERWPELSINPNSSRYISSIINNYSKYITVSAVATEDSTHGYDGVFTVATTSLAGGTAGGTIDQTDWEDAFDKIDAIDGDLVLNAVGIGPGSDVNTIASLVAKASTRGDSFVIVDPDKGLTTAAEIISNASSLSSVTASGYVAHYSPCLKMVDPSKSGPGAIRVTYPGGAIAGIMSKFQSQKTVAAAPAGYTADIVGALGLEASLSAADLGSLYESTTVPVNSFKAIPGAGIVVFGARTLAKTSPDKYIPVRRTLNHLKYQLKALTEFAVFEPNDANLWTRIEAGLSGFLTDFYQKGGLKGNNPNEAYYVVCDSTNNSQTSIDQGYVNVEVGVSLLYPAEYIVINLSQWTGGSNAVDNL